MAATDADASTAARAAGRDALEKRLAATQEAYAATVRALVNAVEARDAYTGGHAGRVAAYALTIAEAAGVRLADNPEIEFGFLLHDVGKVAIPDAILFKPAGLTAEEELLMRRHTVIGFDIVKDIEFLGDARAVVRSHHENWDGTGYPDGLAAEEIPLPARIFAVADALDALTTDRPYRPAQGLGEARRRIAQAAGSQFDPAVIEALDRVPDERLEAIRAGA